MNRPANAKRPVLFYFEHSRPFQYLSRLYLEWELIVLKFLLSLFHLTTVNWKFEASSHEVIVLLFLFIFTFRHFLSSVEMIWFLTVSRLVSTLCFALIFPCFVFCCCRELIWTSWVHFILSGIYLTASQDHLRCREQILECHKSI